MVIFPSHHRLISHFASGALITLLLKVGQLLIWIPFLLVILFAFL